MKKAGSKPTGGSKAAPAAASKAGGAGSIPAQGKANMAQKNSKETF